MKIRSFCLASLVIFSFSLTWAYLPPAKMILEKAIEKNGKPLASIDQEVSIHIGADVYSFREVWLIDSDKNMKVTITGLNELKDKLMIQYLYTGQKKWIHENGKEKTTQNISNDLFERFFYVRSPDELAEYLSAYNMAPKGFFSKKNYTVTKGEFSYDAEPFVKLSRAGGGVSYLFALSNTPSSAIWFEQDRFVIRRILLPSTAELAVDNYQTYEPSFHVGKSKRLSWSGYKAEMKVNSVAKRDNKALAGLQPASLEVSTPLENLRSLKGGEVLIEFFSRFR